MAAPPVFYLIPGLGADERVFQFLGLPGITHVLKWLAPQTPTEPLPHYAARLAEAVPPGQACWLVGVSFGGVLALEVARLRPLARVVLVSSFAGRTYTYDPAAPLDISLPLAPGNDQVNCFWAEPVQFDTIRVGSFVGSVALGGSTNYQRLHVTPHGNGTHTECYGHI